MNTNKSNTMLFSASERGTGLLEVVILVALVVIGAKVLFSFLHVVDVRSCGAMEQALGNCK